MTIHLDEAGIRTLRAMYSLGEKGRTDPLKHEIIAEAANLQEADQFSDHAFDEGVLYGLSQLIDVGLVVALKNGSKWLNGSYSFQPGVEDKVDELLGLSNHRTPAEYLDGTRLRPSTLSD